MAAMVREASQQISNRERHGESSQSNIDLLSQLPDDLLIEIINLLPTEETVRTSVLNKSWRNLWKQIHNICFCFEGNPRASLKDEFRDFDEFLGKLDPSTKNNFCLHFFCNPIGSHDELDSCLSWAVERCVKMLTLDIIIPCHYTFPSLYRVPAILFQCQSLVEVELRNVSTLNMHNMNVSWPLLNGLYLTGTTLNIMDFNNLMKSCPLLERLSLVNCNFRCHSEQASQIRICSTTIRCLKLWKCQFMDDIDVMISLPSLVNISIDMHMGPGGAKERAVLDAVRFVGQIHVGQKHLEAMCKNGIMKSTTIKHVQVEITMHNHKHLEGMAYLISSYCNLHNLVVNFNNLVEDFVNNDDLRRVLHGGKVLEDCLSRMLNLKTIHVCGIEASEVMELRKDTNMDPTGSLEEFRRKMKFQIVRILLKKLIHLEKLTIYLVTRDRSYFGSESRLVEETRKLFEQASPSPTLQVTCESYDCPHALLKFFPSSSCCRYLL